MAWHLQGPLFPFRSGSTLNVFLFVSGDSPQLSGQYVEGVLEMLPTGFVRHYYPRVTALTGSYALVLFPFGRMPCQRVI